jgi:hypothetical protein
MGKGRLGGPLDAVAGGEVVHAESLVSPRPQRNGVLVSVEEIGRKRPHVGTGQEGVAVRLQRALVCREHRGAVAVGEADAGLRAAVRHSAGGELPCHRACKTRDLLNVDIRQHPRPPRPDRKEVVIDDQEGFKPGTGFAELDNAHGYEPMRARGSMRLSRRLGRV